MDCVVCSISVKDSSERRKKLHGPACRDVKATLFSIADEEVVESLEQKPDAYLCYQCNRLLCNISSTRRKLNELVSALKEHLPRSSPSAACMSPMTSISEEPATTSSVDSLQPSHPKRLCSSSAASPNVVVEVPYPSGLKSYTIKTPKRKQAIKRVVRRSHHSIASAVVNSPSTANAVLSDVSKKIIKEMKQFSASDSILSHKYTIESLKYFDWERIWIEFERNIPTLITFFKHIIRCPMENIPLICLLASQVLKSRHSQLGLVQRAVSVMLHGHSTNKQVYKCLQPLQICMSYRWTRRIIDVISEDYDIDMQYWKDELVSCIQEQREERETVDEQPACQSEESTQPSGVAAITTECDHSLPLNCHEGPSQPPAHRPLSIACLQPPTTLPPRSLSSSPILQNDSSSVPISFDYQDVSEGLRDATDSSVKSSIIAPSVSPLYSYSCGSPSSQSLSPPHSCANEVEDSVQEELVACEQEDSAAIRQRGEIVTACVQSTTSHDEIYEQPWFGYKLVLDNFDVNIIPSFQRVDKGKKSLHYVQTYGMRDRIDLSGFSDRSPEPPAYNPNDFLPSHSEVASLKEEFSISLARCITKFMPDHKHESKTVVQHIPSKHSKEMGSKSVVVPLGILPLNEDKIADMSKILEHYHHQYIPTRAAEGHHTLPDGSTLHIDDTQFFSVLLGGDQLSVARARSAQALRTSHNTPLERLQGILPVLLISLHLERAGNSPWGVAHYWFEPRPRFGPQEKEQEKSFKTLPRSWS